MAAKRRPAAAPKPAAQDKAATLKDLLSPEVLSKLKAQADDLKAEEAKRREEEKKRVEEARRAERKRLENDFEHLLNNSSMDWKKYK